jgi:ABC-type polysaccharide/polyol phosphate export permease
VRLVAYILPVTYGISGFQEVMLRGSTPPDWVFAGPALITIVTTVATSLLLRLQFRQR